MAIFHCYVSSPEGINGRSVDGDDINGISLEKKIGMAMIQWMGQRNPKNPLVGRNLR